MSRFDDARIVKGTGFDVHEGRMLRGGRKDGRATFWTEMTGEFIAAVALLRESLRTSTGDAEIREVEADTDIESAPGAPPTVLAVAVVCRADRSAVLVRDVAT
jgi:hypothetical protein